jgi:hypothetical protein
MSHSIDTLKSRSCSFYQLHPLLSYYDFKYQRSFLFSDLLFFSRRLSFKGLFKMIFATYLGLPLPGNDFLSKIGEGSVDVLDSGPWYKKSAIIYRLHIIFRFFIIIIVVIILITILFYGLSYFIRNDFTCYTIRILFINNARSLNRRFLTLSYCDLSELFFLTNI